MAERKVNIRPVPAFLSPRVKSPPTSAGIKIPFLYSSSDDGTDENLLILLHGLGDTHASFAKLGKKLNLPQTATLALRAPDQIPFLDTPAFQWYISFDLLGDTLPNPNPTAALSLLASILTHLTDTCGWPVERIHLFGFGQGGTLAAECALEMWKKSASPSTDEAATARVRLGSVVSIAGPLLSYPTLPKSSLCPTSLMIFHRTLQSRDDEGDQMTLTSSALTALRKGFSSVVESKGTAGGGMPRSREEWEPIMRFWSQHLSRRQVDGLYEVMSGMA